VFAAEERTASFLGHRGIRPYMATGLREENHQYFTIQQMDFQNCCIFAAG
jgi:hypothetical protein